MKKPTTLEWLGSVQHVGRKNSLVLYATPPAKILRRLQRAYLDVYILEPYAPEQKPAAARGVVIWRNGAGEEINFLNDAGATLRMETGNAKGSA